MRFPYLEYEGRHLPMVPVKLKSRHGWVEFLAFVDSGAGYSIFKSSAAEILGLEIETGKKEFVKIGDGSFIEVFAFNLGFLDSAALMHRFLLLALGWL